LSPPSERGSSPSPSLGSTEVVQLPPPSGTLSTGSKYVLRGDISQGRASELARRLPSFVFLVLLPLLGRPEAMRVAARAERLSNS